MTVGTCLTLDIGGIISGKWGNFSTESTNSKHAWHTSVHDCNWIYQECIKLAK